MLACPICNRPRDARYVNTAASEACVDPCHWPYLTPQEVSDASRILDRISPTAAVLGLHALRDSSEYGWISITRAEYEKKAAHDYAGPGTPCHPDRPGVWVMGMDESGATCLWTGVTIDERA